MLRKILVAGFLGGVLLVVWTFVANTYFGFYSRVYLKRGPNERAVYTVLNDNLAAPGRYIFNPALTPEGTFPLRDPVFAVMYSGIGHEAAGREMYTRLAFFFVISWIAAAMLALASSRVLCSYPRRVLFVAAIGLLMALYSDFPQSGIAGFPLHDGLLLAAYSVLTWLLLGLLLAWRIRAES